MQRIPGRRHPLHGARNAPETGQVVTAEMVAYAASLMGIGDFELFTRALEIWHGGPPAEAVVEKSFSAYLRNGEIPFWVRDYVRKVLADPERCRRERRRRVVALILYYVPLALMFAVIMYFMAW